MKLAHLLLFVFIPFVNFSQEVEIHKGLSLELGYQIFAASKSSEEFQGNSGPGHGFYYYQVDKAQIVGQQGHLQLNLNIDRFTFPLGVGYLHIDEELLGSERGGSNLTTIPSYYASSFTFKRYSDYGTLFTGIGVNLLSKPKKVFFGPILRFNYAYLFQHVITDNKSTYSQYFATNYIEQGKGAKHSIRRSIGLLFRINTEFGLQFNLEAGYKRLNNNAVSFNYVKPLKNAAYAQFSIGFDLSKFSKKTR